MSATSAPLFPPVWYKRCLGRVSTSWVGDYSTHISLATVLGLVGFQVWAATNFYALRVTADAPSFLVLIRDMGAEPLDSHSSFFGQPDTDSIHASPYLQVLGLIWRVMAPTGEYGDALALGQFVAFVSIPVTLFVLGMLWLYVRQAASTRAAYLAIPVLLMVFGPVHVTFPSDLSLNGFLYAAYYPTTFATGLTLAVLVMLQRSSLVWSAFTSIVIALTISTDPLNGAVLAALMILYACKRGEASRREAVRIPLMLAAGFLVAQAWPAFDVYATFNSNGVPVPAVVGAAFVAPWAWRAARPRASVALRRRAPWFSTPISGRQELAVATVAALAVIALTGWGIWEMLTPPDDQPLLKGNRRGFYWNGERYRWLLLLAPAAIGLLGANRLARRGRPIALLWFLIFYSFGVVGSVAELLGVHIPLYYRFILLCQVPIAIGVAYLLTQHKESGAVTLTGWVVLFVLAFKTVTLIGVSDRLSYFGAELPGTWYMNKVIPPDSGVVASDPYTSYYIPAVTQNRVVTLSPGHADSGAEGDVAKRGYGVLHRLWAADGPSAGRALTGLWDGGVRYVIVERFTTLRPRTLRAFVAAPYNELIKPRDVPQRLRYEARLSMAGTVIAPLPGFRVYGLDPKLYKQAVGSSRGIDPKSVPRVRTLLSSIPATPLGTTSRTADELSRLGVRIVTMNHGWIGTQPRLTAYGGSVASPVEVSVAISGKRTSTGCDRACGRAVPVVRELGILQVRDPDYTVTRLPGERGS